MSRAVRPCGLASTDPAPCRADFGDRPTLDMPEAALKERKKAVDQVDMEDKPSWCASILSALLAVQTVSRVNALAVQSVYNANAPYELGVHLGATSTRRHNPQAARRRSAL